jgi:cytochrome bd-type quinol oxidase subunit 1
MVILLMTLMGYARSSSRVHWHVYGVVRDTSPYAYSPALGSAAAIMALCTFFFCMLVAFIFWVATMSDKAKAPSAPSKGELPHGMPAMAGASSALDGPRRPSSEL